MRQQTLRVIINLVKTIIFSVVVLFLITGVIRIIFQQELLGMNEDLLLSMPALEGNLMNFRAGWLFEWWQRYKSGNLLSHVLVPMVPVTDLIELKKYMPLEILTYSGIIGCVVGIPIGIVAGFMDRKRMDLFFRSLILLLTIVVPFALGILFQYFFAIKEGIYPTIGLATLICLPDL